MIKDAKFHLGQVVKHRLYDFRGLIYDVDPEYDNTDEWYEAIPQHVRPRKDQPFYHLYAENERSTYEAYVSEQNLLIDESGEPMRHPRVCTDYERLPDGSYRLRDGLAH